MVNRPPFVFACYIEHDGWLVGTIQGRVIARYVFASMALALAARSDRFVQEDLVAPSSCLPSFCSNRPGIKA